MKYLMALMVVGTSLSGCTSYSNKFDCPYGEGLGCASLSKVDKMIDANMVKTEEDLSSVSGIDTHKSVRIYFGPNRPSKPLTVERF